MLLNVDEPFSPNLLFDTRTRNRPPFSKEPTRNIRKDSCTLYSDVCSSLTFTHPRAPCRLRDRCDAAQVGDFRQRLRGEGRGGVPAVLCDRVGGPREELPRRLPRGAYVERSFSNLKTFGQLRSLSIWKTAKYFCAGAADVLPEHGRRGRRQRHLPGVPRQPAVRARQCHLYQQGRLRKAQAFSTPPEQKCQSLAFSEFRSPSKPAGDHIVHSYLRRKQERVEIENIYRRLVFVFPAFSPTFRYGKIRFWRGVQDPIP